MRCKACNKIRKVNENDYCKECQAEIYILGLYVLGKLFTDAEWTQAFCDDIAAVGEAMKKAMQALQGRK